MADWRETRTTTGLDKYGIPNQTHPTAATGAPGTTGAFVTSDPLGAPGTTGADFTSQDTINIPGGFSPIYDTEVIATTDVSGGGGQQQQLRRPASGREEEEEEKVRQRDDERAAQYSVLRETRNLEQETNVDFAKAVDSSGREREREVKRTSGGGGYGGDMEDEKESKSKRDDVEMETRGKRRDDDERKVGKGGVSSVSTAQAPGTGLVYGRQSPSTEFTASCPREGQVSEYESFPTMTGSARGSTGAFKTSDHPLGAPGSTAAEVTGPVSTTIPGVGPGVYDPVVGGRTHMSQQQPHQQQQHQQQPPQHGMSQQQKQLNQTQQQHHPEQQFYHPPTAGGGVNPNSNPNLNRGYKTETHHGSGGGLQATDPNLEAARIQVVSTAPTPGGGIMYGRETITTTANLSPRGGGSTATTGRHNNQPPQEQWERIEKKGLTDRAKEIKDRLGGGGGSH